MNIVEYVATELRKLRAGKNVSQTDVSSALNINVGSIVRYEKGSVTIDIVMLENLLNYYNISYSDFFKSYELYKNV